MRAKRRSVVSGALALAAAGAAGRDARGQDAAGRGGGTLPPGAARQVTVGGLAGFAGLADPAATAALRATGRAGLYLHAEALAHAAPATLSAIYAVFRGTGPAHVELGMQEAPAAMHSLLESFVPDHATRLGQPVDRASVNGIDFGAPPERLDQWRQFVAIARATGIAVVAPVYAPNNPALPLDLGDAGYAVLRAAALHGGGLTVDAPPGYFLERGSAYQAFVAREVRWARENRLRSTVILSPWGPPDFGAQARAAVEALRRLDALPDEFAVECYDPAMTASSPVAVGREDQPDSVTGVALRLAAATSAFVQDHP